MIVNSSVLLGYKEILYYEIVSFDNFEILVNYSSSKNS